MGIKPQWDGAQYAVIYPIQMDDMRELYIEERGERLSGLGPVATEISGIILNVDNAQAEQRRAAYAASHDSLNGIERVSVKDWNISLLSRGVTAPRRYVCSCVCLISRISIRHMDMKRVTVF